MARRPRHPIQKTPAVRAAEGAAEELRATWQGEKMVLNLGPSHPATHRRVWRIVLELDRRRFISKAIPEHRVSASRRTKKIAENMTYTKFIPYQRIGWIISRPTREQTSPTRARGPKNFSAFTTNFRRAAKYIRVICLRNWRRIFVATCSGLGGVLDWDLGRGFHGFFLLTFTEREKKFTTSAKSLTGGAVHERVTTRIRRRFRATPPPGWCDGARPQIFFRPKSSSKHSPRMETLLHAQSHLGGSQRRRWSA